jgi:type IV pilus assembly protein PilA
MRSYRGFSLIELLIVVAIILIIAAIAVPNLLRSRMAANESSAAQSMRTVATGNTTYFSVYGIGYALELSKLGPPAGGAVTTDAADLIDISLAINQAKSGYNFTTYTNDGNAGTQASPVLQFTLAATPTVVQSTGVSTFCVDGTSVVRKDPTGVVVAADTPGQKCDPGDGSVFPPL